MDFIRKLGVLRGLLLLLLTLLMGYGVYCRFSDTNNPEILSHILKSAVAPALAVICIFVLMLDIVMNYVFQFESETLDSLRHRWIIRIDFVMLVGLLSIWVPQILKQLGYL